MGELGYMGEQTAYEDEIVKRTLDRVKKTEQKLIDEYNNLIDFKTNNYEEFLPYINDELDKRKVYLQYKKTSLENQHAALLKILEHFLTINLKNKQFETEKILTKLSMVEKELIKYNKIL
jgi:predicted restriction endonuclease